MENSSSTTLVVQTGHSYTAGSTAKGKCYLNVSNPSGIRARKLQITLEGKEKTAVRYETTRHLGTGIRRTVRQTHYARGESNILNIDHTVASFPGGIISPGQYEFPFEAVLPPGLPSTMSCHSGRSHCEITYKILARLEGCTSAKSQQIIRVLAKPKASDYLEGPVVCAPDTQAVNFCCCFNKGQMTLEAMANRGIVSGGEQLDVSYACTNDSTVPIESLNLDLLEVVYWQASSHCETQVQSRASAALPSPVARTSRDSERMQPLQRLSHTRLYIHSGIRDSYEGRLIHIRHEVSLKAHTRFCITNPEVLMLVYSQPPSVNPLAPAVPLAPVEPSAPTIAESVEEDEIELPPGWSPTTAAGVEIPTAYVVGYGDDFHPTSSAPLAEAEIVGDPSAPPLPPQGATTVKSLDQIVNQMDRAFDQYSLLERLSHEPGWQEVLENLSPDQYALLLTKVKSVFDQPKCAKLMGETLGPKFTCAHVAAACRKISNLYRTNVVNATAPLCVDLNVNKGLIENTLDGYERIQCQDVLSLWGWSRD